MEIYRQTTNIVEFEAPENGTVVSADASLNGAPPVVLTVSGNGGTTRIRTVTLPYINDEGTVKITWRFNTSVFTEAGVSTGQVSHNDTYNIVTPILSRQEIKGVWEDATEQEISNIEPAVRHIINAHTGQRFGRFVGTHKVRGSDTFSLPLPSRLQTLTSVNGDIANVTYFEIVGDGYYLNHYPWGIPPVRADYHELHQHKGGVIHNPNHVKLGQFYKSKTYEINGVWGWDEVPAQVREAAKLLVNDYACGDSQYRDRYLTSMTAADWRIQFNVGAFSKTGNVRADQLLADYVLQRGWAVL